MGVRHAEFFTFGMGFAEGRADFCRCLPIGVRVRRFLFDVRVDARMDLPGLSGATWRNSFTRARRLAVEMGHRGLRRQLFMDADHMREFDAAGEGERRQKPSKCSAKTFGFD